MTVDYQADEAPQLLIVPTAVPYGRGRWRFTLHRRQFADATWGQTIIAEMNVRGRQIVQAWDNPATVTFTLDGHDPAATLVMEMATDVICWRWDEWSGADVAVGRFIIDHSEDQISTESATVTFTGHDYLAMLTRRYITSTLTNTQQDQDWWAAQLVNAAVQAQSSSGTSFFPGSYLPVKVTPVAPNGSPRANSGQLRDRTYAPSSEIGQMLDDLAKVIGGFDYDLIPGARTNAVTDSIRIFYNPAQDLNPNQGVPRTDLALQYGSTVSALTRTVSSADYGNYWRILGNNGSSDPNAAQLYSEAWNHDADDVTVNPVGLWMGVDNAADVIIQSTLDQKAQGDLNNSGILVPTYTVTMRPGAYRWGYPNMGDLVPLIIKIGRLNVNTKLRVMGITYDIGDDGQEDVSLVLGRSPTTLADLFTQADRDVDALTRR